MGAQVFGDRWQVVESIGEGGQGYVFRVVDILDPKRTPHVLKRIKNVDRLPRFIQEAEALKRLSHPNIVRLVDDGLSTQKPYLVMEFCASGALADHSGRWHDDPSRAMRLFRDICQAVAAAHGAGVVHRDLKPANILLRNPDGPPVIADFGICYVEDGERHTLTEEAVGPRRYMAPELEDGRADRVVAASDVYSLGKVLYWLLSGGKDFAREKHREPTYDLAKITSNGAFEHVNRLLDRMVTPEPSTRFKSAAEVVPALDNAMRLFAGDYRIVSARLRQRCTYCGEGEYTFVVGKRQHPDVHNFGLSFVGDPSWRVLVCDLCGHIQLFRVDLAKRKEWWAE